jgi:hypothetical protein
MKAWTKKEINDLTSEQYKANFGDERVGLTDEQKNFRATIDGDTAVAAPVQAPRLTAQSPRGRAQAAVETAAPAFDPSFDESPATPAVAANVLPVEVLAEVPAEVVPVVPVPAPASIELPEQIHEYVNRDENGKQIGGVQRFKYRTQDELIGKLTKANQHAMALVQKEREQRILNETEAPADTTTAKQLAFRPVLSDEGRAELEAKLQDAAEAARAQYQLDRDDDHRAHNELVQSNYVNSVMLALESFKNRNRDFIQTPENAAKLVGFIERRHLDPSEMKSYQRAFEVLRDSGIIETASGNQSVQPALVEPTPTVREEKTAPNTPVPAEVPARISEPTLPQKQAPAPISTGLSNADSVSDLDNPLPKAHWLTIRVHLKDGKGNPVAQYQEFHDLDAIDHCDDKALRRIIAAQTPETKAIKDAWDTAEEAKQRRLTINAGKRGYPR